MQYLQKEAFQKSTRSKYKRNFVRNDFIFYGWMYFVQIFCQIRAVSGYLNFYAMETKQRKLFRLLGWLRLIETGLCTIFTN